MASTIEAAAAPGAYQQFDQFATAHFSAFDDLVQALFLHEVGYRDALYRGVFGQGNHRVAVAAQQQSLDVQWGAADFVGQESAVACRVQYAGHTHNAVGRQFGSQVCAVGHHVQRVGYDDDLCIGRVFYYLLGNGFYDSSIDADQVVTAHARFAGHARGDHYDVRTFGFGVVVGRTRQTGVESADGGCLPNVERFALGNTFFDVQQDDLIDEIAAGQYIGACSTYVSCSYYGYFHGKYVFMLSVLSERFLFPAYRKEAAVQRSFLPSFRLPLFCPSLRLFPSRLFCPSLLAHFPPPLPFQTPSALEERDEVPHAFGRDIQS